MLRAGLPPPRNNLTVPLMDTNGYHRQIATLPRIKRSRRGTLRQIAELQDALYKDATDIGTSAASRAQVARAWDVLEERKRIFKMKPKPKDIDTTKQPAKPKRTPAQPDFQDDGGKESLKTPRPSGHPLGGEAATNRGA